MKRLILKQTGEGQRESKPVPTNNDLVQVFITGMAWKIVSLTDQKVLAEGVGTGEHSIRATIKKELKNLGVDYLDEVRKRKEKNV